MKDDQFDLHARIEEDHWWFVGRRIIIRTVLHQVVPPSKSILAIDVGCGTGANIAALASDYICHGIDASEHAIRHAKMRFPTVNFTCGDVHEIIGETDKQPKLFLLLDVIEHIRDDRSFLQRLISSMNKGDRVLITVPADMRLWSPHDENHGHYRRYDVSELEKTWTGQDVEPIMVTYFNALLYPVIKAVRIYNRFRNKEWGEAGTDLKIPPRLMNRLLTALFSSEALILKRMLRNGTANRRLPFGVSLMAFLRKR